jgi:NADPH-dependent 2,4-dienoyl-CoA reductase/sulfur reductase-like enzyme
MRFYQYVILGGGMVAGYAAKELVARGLPPEQLAIVSADRELPYERPPLSKGFLAGKKDAASLLINSVEFYRDHGIDVLLNTEVKALDLNSKRLTTEPAGDLGFEKLVIATGARVRTLALPGSDLDGLLYLRTLDDSARIHAQARDALSRDAQSGGVGRAVVIGAGFIGMEVAAVLT